MSTPAHRRAVALGSAVVVLLGLAVPAAATPSHALESSPRAAAPRTTDGPTTDGIAGEPTTGVLDMATGLPIQPPEPTSDGTSDGSAGGPTGGSTAERTGVDPAVRDALAAGDDVAVLIRLVEQVDAAALTERADRAAEQAEAQARHDLALAGALPDDNAAAIDQAGDAARASVVVETLQAVGAASRARVAAALAEQEAAGHTNDVTPFWVFNGFAARVDAAGLDALAGNADVASVTLDETVMLPEVSPSGGVDLPTWSLESVHAPQVWGDYGVRGEGVVVGVMDSGVDGTHPALSGSWRGRDGDVSTSWFVATGENYPQPYDGFGHGTHVTGSIVGAPPGEVIGVAPEAQWIAAKIFRDAGSTTESIIHAGFEWMLAPGGDPGAAPDVVNNSWGSTATYQTEFMPDVDAWRAAGIVPLFSAGNSGPGTETIGSPGSFPQTIAVGATDVNDLVAGFSSRGPVFWDDQRYLKPQIAAPGVDVVSAWPQQLGGGYEELSGTSMAAPHVTGVTALLLSADPSLSIDEIEEILTETAREAPHMGALPNDNYGFGISDAYAAVTRAAFAGHVIGTVQGPDGPIEGATVGTSPDVSTTTDEAGNYELFVPAGEHVLTASTYGYEPASRSITVVTGETSTEDFDLSLAAEHPVTGTVNGTDGPIRGARVVLDGTPLDPAYTDVDGAFEMVVAEGTYVLRITAAGYAPETQELTVDGSESLTITLEPIGTPSLPGWAQHQNNPGRSGFAPEDLAGPTLVDDWSTDLNSPVVFSSPVTADGLVYIGTDDGRLNALETETGERVWTHQAGDARRGTPAVVDGTVYTGGGVNGGFFALDAETGAVRWSVPTPNRLTVYGAPAVLDGVVYVVTGPTDDRSDTVLALDAATGAQLWSVDVGMLVYAGPAVGSGIVVVGNGDVGDLIGLDADSGDEVWRITRTDDHFVSSASVVDGVAYIATTGNDGSSGNVLAVDVATGDLLWDTAGNGDGQGGTPTVYGDLVITTSHAFGAVTAYDRASGAEVWRHTVAGAVSAAVLASNDGYVFAGSQLDQRFFALDATTGAEVWSAPAGANVTTAPALADGRVITAGVDGVVHAFHPTGKVSGSITGPDGPMAATVRIVETGLEVTSDPDTGAYELVHRPGDYTLEVRAYGFTQVSQPVEILAGRTLELDHDLQAVGDGSLSGLVHGEDGPAIEGAEVTLVGTPLDPVLTDALGGFELDPVAAGSYTLRVAADGFQPLELSVSITAGEETVLDDIALLRYQIAVTGDYQGRIVEELVDLGYRVESTTYAEVTDHADAYQLVVANGAQDDPGEAAFLAFIEATDSAGTSVVWLDQWSLGWGATNHLLKYLGDPAELPDEYGNSGRVTVRSIAEHPLTDGLPLDEPVDLLGRGNDWSAFAGWSGVTVAELATDVHGVAGGAVGYQPRGTGSAHVLLGSLAAAASWGIPDEHWTENARIVFGNAIDYALTAEYGEVKGTVTDGGGAPFADVNVEVVGGLDSTTSAADGSYSILLPPGEHTLKFSAVGSTPVLEDVVVEAGDSQVLDVELEASGLGAVSGTITSARDGAGLAGALVELVESGQSATTGPDGSYTISDVPAGTYEMRVSADGHLSATRPVEVTAGATTDVDVVLDPAPVVGVLGDYSTDGVVAFLQANEISAEAIDWPDVDRVGDFDVIVFNDPTDPGEAPFLAFLDAMDAAQVSGIFGDDWLGAAIDGLLVDHLGDPEATDWLSADGTVSYHPLVEDHPLFEGIDGDALMFSDTSTYGTWFTGYSGIPLAETVGEIEGAQGVGVAYKPRTPGSIHLLLGGLAVTSIGHSPNDGWSEDAPQFYLNAIAFAAAPGLGSVAGNVSSTSGEPLDATVEVLGTSLETTTDPADGSYELALAPGTYTLRVTSFGYTPVEVSATVEAGVETELDVELTPGAGGQVTGVITAGGDVTPPGGGTGPLAGEPVEGAVVTLVGTPRSTTTDAEGRYALDVVAPGSYELEVLADGFVRTRADIVVADGETTTQDLELRVTPRVAVIDEDGAYPHATGYLSYWGYDPIEISWADTATLAEVDLVVANLASFPNQDPSDSGWAAFEDAVNRAGVPVVWLDQFGRGSFQWLVKYDGDPMTKGSDRSNDTVTATATDPDHPLLAGLPDEFPLVALDGEYSWYGDFSGTTVATVSSSLDPVAGGNLAGYRARGAGAVDVLLGSLSISTYGWPGYGSVPADSWTPEAERLLRNALGFALDTDGLGAEARGRVVDSEETGIESSVTVVETGEVYPARAGDGAFVVPLAAGTWTLRADAFGWQPNEIEVTVAAGDVVTPQITLTRDAVGTIAGRVSGPSGAVAGATVALEGTDVVATTAADGTYEIPGVPTGDWSLHVEAAGFMDARRPVTVSEDETVVADFTLEPSRPVAVVEDSTQDSIELLLEAEGYTVEAFEDTGLATLAGRIDDFRLVIVNNAIASSQHAAFTATLDAAAAAGVSVILAGQWGGGAIDDIREIRGDPATTEWDFVEDTTIEFTPTGEHPIFAGFPVGEPITLMGNATENQQWLAYDGYSGTKLADLTSDDPEDGPIIGDGVGYRFSSATSVEILLASLGAGTYGRPDEPVGAAGRWTPDAVRIYLNAVDWATSAEQGAVTGTVTEDGEPVEGATITAVELGASTTTAADGSYTLGLPDGTHTIRFEAFGYEPVEETVEIVEAGTVQLDVELVPTPRGSVVGTISSGGQPISGAVVSGDGPESWTVQTETDGTYDSGPVLPGEYVVTVEAEGYVGAEETITVTAGEPTTLDVTLAKIDIGVLGDWQGELTAMLVRRGVPAAELNWSGDLDLSPYEVVVVNGGDPDQAMFDAMLDEAESEDVSLVYTGTWGVDQGGIRLLERYTDRVEVGAQGYGEGRVKLVQLDPDHPLFKRIPSKARLIGLGGYYSVLDSYVGTSAGRLRIGDRHGDDRRAHGTGVAYDWLSADRVEILLSASAVTGMVGPGDGWRRYNKRLVVNAVRWASVAQSPNATGG